MSAFTLTAENSYSFQDIDQFKVIRRNGSVVQLEPLKIATAMTKAFLSVEGENSSTSARVRELVEQLTGSVVTALVKRQPNGGTFHIEDIQDQVELSLMRSGEHEVARFYVLYREQRNQKRNKAKNKKLAADAANISRNVKVKGELQPLDTELLLAQIEAACVNLGEAVDAELILKRTLKDLYDGVPVEELRKCTILSSRSLIEQDPAYTYVTARLLLNTIRCEILGEEVPQEQMQEKYELYFPKYVKQGIKAGLLDDKLSQFDLKKLAKALVPERDLQFDYLGLQTLYDRYFLHIDEKRIELPQAFFMRVAMGLSLNELNRTEKTIEFYNLLSTFQFMSSTPTLFNSGTNRSQLSSCYLSTVSDDLEGIFDALKDDALLSKYAGGLGNDWTNVRALGSHIKGTNGKSQGVIPFLKVLNDTAVAVNQGGKRKGAVCSYLETWHLDMEEFLDLRKNTGDDRRRTHDMNTSNWIPDLFMKRVMEGGNWTLFSPSDCPDLHDKFGLDFEKAYVAYEEKAYSGEMKLFKTVVAATLWRKMLTMLFETGHPWVTFKDPCNIRSPQQHVGVVHSSNLCVAPEVKILTDEGYVTISEKVGEYVNVWNGDEFSNVQILKTGEDQKIIKVKLSNGVDIPCTPYHKFYIQDKYWSKKPVEKRAHELVKGDKLIKFALPIIEKELALEHAYTSGFFCGDGYYSRDKPFISLYGEKKLLVKHLAIKKGIHQEQKSTGRLSFSLNENILKKFTVPFNFSIKSRLEWLAGLLDSDGSVSRNGTNESLQIGSIEERFLLDVRLLLQTVGVNSKVTRMRDSGTVKFKKDVSSYKTKPLYRLLINSTGTQQLLALGLDVKRLKIKLQQPHRVAEEFVSVIEVIDDERIDDTYCFSEPIRHMGVFNGVLLGNCTEITLNTSETEIAVCNLGSVNLKLHLHPVGHEQYGKMDHVKLKATIKTALRMLDNVIDINYYAVDKARNSNLKHRPIGLGIMGFQDALHELKIPYASNEAVEFADRSMEAVCYFAYLASTELAEERGAYLTYKGSLWDKGYVPHETINILKESRGEYLEVNDSVTMDWAMLKDRIKHFGMRNSNCVAIAPTATISNIIGVSASIEPTYQNIFVKSNLSGEFTIINEYLVKDLKKLGLWDDVMIADLKYFDGSLVKIDRIPAELKSLYATAFEVEPQWLIEAASRRQKWIDQAQSLNIYMAGVSGKKLDETYKLAWLRGLKTTYYLRTMGATSAEKSTSRAGALNAVSNEVVKEEETKFCSIDNPECEACQ